MFVNETGFVAVILGNASSNATGSIFLTLLLVVVALLIICLSAKIPLEFSAIFLLPLLLTYMAYYQAFVALGGVLIIYLAIVTAQHFFFNLK